MNRRPFTFLMSIVLFILLVPGEMPFTTTLAQQTQFTCVQPPSGLISWWPGEGDANDALGSNNGTLVGGATFVSGKVGQAFKLNGVNGYVTINSQVYSLSGGTVELWFLREGVGSVSSPNTIVGSYGGTGNQRAPTFFVPGGDGSTLRWEFGSLITRDTQKAIHLNEWHHAAMTYDGNFNVKVYFDGTLVAFGTSQNPADFFDQVHIGHYANFGQEFFPGRIDEVAIYNRPLDAAEIQAIYNAGSAGKCRAGGPTSSISGRVTDASSLESQIAVDARTEWQDTGIAVQTGDQVQVIYRSGTWTIWKGVDPYTDANGQVGRTNECTLPLPSANIGGLVGRVSTGTVQFFGNSGSLIAPNSGTLHLSMNDCTGHFQDNDGTLTVQVTVTPPIPGVTIADGAGHTATTDASGNYRLSGLTAATYTLTPSKSGYTFSPASRTIAIPPDMPNVNFVGALSVDPLRFQKGDVFITDSSSVRHYTAAGTLLETIDTGTTDNDQCAFDATGNLYVTTPGSVIRFKGPDTPHTNLGPFGNVANAAPIVFDASGNVYVGVEDFAAPFVFLYKFDKAGNLLDQFTPGIEVNFAGIDSMDLAVDQKTLFYASDGKRILRYDVSTHTQLPDFVSVLPGLYAGGLRILPDGGVLVANAEFILHLDSAGNEVKRYDAGAVNAWHSLSLDPDGTSFWAQSEDSAVLYKFDIATGNLLLSPATTSNAEGSLCVFERTSPPICVTATGSQDGPVCPVPIEPVIFLNGIAGSELWLRDDHSRIWPSPRTTSKMPLSLKPGDPNHIYVNDVIRRYVFDVYGSFIDRFTDKGQDGGGYTEYIAGNSPHTHCDPNQQPTATLYVYAWDWRYGVASVADRTRQIEELKSYLDCVLQQHPGQKINLVAHSMGGMYSLLFLLKNQGYPIDNIITMGTPWLGAPKAIYMMLNGDFMWALIPASETRALLEYFPGAHQLLPAEVYDTHAPLRSLSILDTTEPNAPTHHDVPIAYPELQATLQKQYVPQSAIPFLENNKVVFDTPGFTDWNRASSPVQFHVLYGQQWSDNTVIQTKQTIQRRCYTAPPSTVPVCPPPFIDFVPVKGQGDGTVPVTSAGWPDQPTHSSNVHVYWFVNQTWLSEQREALDHQSLPQNARIQDCVLSILQPAKGYVCNDDGTNVRTASVSTNSQPRHIEIFGASFISVTDGITLSDNLLESGEFLAAFPGLSVTHINVDSVHLVIPSDAPYSITVKPGTQGILIQNKLGLDVQPIEIRRYDSLSNAAADAFIITNGANNTAQLAQDVDHDGKGDVIITPFAVVTGSATLDTQPPMITIGYDGNTKTVTISATDEQSGISRIFYSFDGLNYLLYQQPVVIVPDVSKVYAQAEDKMGNMSNIKMLDISSSPPLIYLPIVSR